MPLLSGYSSVRKKKKNESLPQGERNHRLTFSQEFDLGDRIV